MAKKRRAKRELLRDRRTTYVGGYSPKPGVGLADIPKDLFRPKTTEELINEGHS